MPPFSRSARTLIQQPGEQRHIKDLKDLRGSAVQDAIDIKVLQTLGMARDKPAHYTKNVPWNVARGPVPRERSVV